MASTGCPHDPYDAADHSTSHDTQSGRGTYHYRKYRDALCYARLVLTTLFPPRTCPEPDHQHGVVAPEGQVWEPRIQILASPLCNGEPSPGHPCGGATRTPTLTFAQQRVTQHDSQTRAPQHQIAEFAVENYGDPQNSVDAGESMQGSPLALTLTSDDDDGSSGVTPCS